MDLKEDSILGEKIHSYWYYVSKGRAIRTLLGHDFSVDEILDVGAGSGIFFKQLIDHGVCKKSICIDPVYEQEKEEVYNCKIIQFVRSIGEATQKLVLLMNVLEYVLNDVELLKKYTGTMPKGGKALITAPAFQFIWSEHDVFLEHYRRYTIGQIEKVIDKANLVSIKGHYFFAVKFPVITATRLFKNILIDYKKIRNKSDLKIYPVWLNKILILICDMECILLYPFNRFFGLSVIVLCEKNSKYRKYNDLQQKTCR